MENLAGNKNCDRIIEQELAQAEINILRGSPSEGEVKSSLTGVLETKVGTFKLSRAWRYWVVEGLVPLDIAEKLYAHPEGKVTVRAAGHCACPPPKEWVEWIDKNGKKLGHLNEIEKYSPDSLIRKMAEESKDYRFVEDPTKEGNPYITCYHIDSQAGLLLFSLMIQGKL